MTSLRAFQDEIEEIHQREVIKKRAQTLIERQNLKEKDKKDAKKESKDTKNTIQSAAVSPPQADAQPADDEEESLSDVETKIQVRTILRFLVWSVNFCFLVDIAIIIRSRTSRQRPRPNSWALDKMQRGAHFQDWFSPITHRVTRGRTCNRGCGDAWRFANKGRDRNLEDSNSGNRRRGRRKGTQLLYSQRDIPL